MRDISSMSTGNALALNRRNSLPCTVRTSIQKSCKDWLSQNGLALDCYKQSTEVRTLYNLCMFVNLSVHIINSFLKEHSFSLTRIYLSTHRSPKPIPTVF